MDVCALKHLTQRFLLSAVQVICMVGINDLLRVGKSADEVGKANGDKRLAPML